MTAHVEATSSVIGRCGGTSRRGFGPVGLGSSIDPSGDRFVGRAPPSDRGRRAAVGPFSLRWPGGPD